MTLIDSVSTRRSNRYATFLVSAMCPCFFSGVVRVTSWTWQRRQNPSRPLFQAFLQQRCGSSSRKRRQLRQNAGRPLGPNTEDLPLLLSAAGMARLGTKPENRHSPLIGLDVAYSNFGIALSNQDKTRAFPVTVVRRADAKGNRFDPRTVFPKLQSIIDDSSAFGLVVGWPLQKSGIAEFQCVMVLRFLQQMRKKGEITLPVTLHDERMSTKEARRKLQHEHGIYGDDELSELENQTAASLILQRFLECKVVRDANASESDGCDRGR